MPLKYNIQISIIRSILIYENMSFSVFQKNMRHENLQSFSLLSSDAETTIMSTLKSLGRNNPMSIPFLDEEESNGFTIQVEGGKEVLIFSGLRLTFELTSFSGNILVQCKVRFSALEILNILKRNL